MIVLSKFGGPLPPLRLRMRLRPSPCTLHRSWFTRRAIQRDISISKVHPLRVTFRVNHTCAPPAATYEACSWRSLFETVFISEASSSNEKFPFPLIDSPDQGGGSRGMSRVGGPFPQGWSWQHWIRRKVWQACHIVLWRRQFLTILLSPANPT